MKSLMMLWKVVLTECGDRCGASTARDLKTATSRFEHEGLSFFTLTLPRFCSDFEKSLAEGGVAHDSFAGYSRTKGLPRFLGGFLELVFDRVTGVLLEDPSIEAIFSLRQVTLLLKKLEIPCTDARNQKAVEGYLECEQEMKMFVLPNLDRFRSVTSILWADVFNRVSQDIREEKIVPKHGPGATADKLKGNLKFNQLEWPERLEDVFPFVDNVLPNYRFYSHRSSVHFLEPGKERPVKITLVPKTSKTPRLIAIEPTCMQYTQQALFGSVREAIEGIDSPSYHRFVGFEDQDPNRVMALEGSRSGQFSTIDLSEASDRVSNQLVREMVARWPFVAEAFDATRSRKADVFGKTVRLAKFASMGSALTFPVEAMVFTTVVFLGIEKALNTQFTSRKQIMPFIGHVRVYGDDIIVPTEYALSVMAELEAFGFKVNRSKTFWTGKFRESCGKEYYDGHDVSVVKLTQVLPQSRTDVKELESICSIRNQFYWHGMWQTARFLDSWIRSILRYFPIKESTSPLLGRESVLPYEAERIHGSTHGPLVRAYLPRRLPPSSIIDDYAALQKFFLQQGEEPIADPKHLERSGRPSSARINLRWVQPY